MAARKQEPTVPTETLKLNKEKLEALEKRVKKQLKKESKFLNEPTAEELIKDYLTSSPDTAITKSTVRIPKKTIKKVYKLMEIKGRFPSY